MLPICIVLAFKTWLGHFSNFNLGPSRSVLFVAIGFTMVIIDFFMKYLVGKDKIQYVWLIETIMVGALCVMIVPKILEMSHA